MAIKKPFEADGGLTVNNSLIIDASGTWLGSAIPILKGGTGAITAAQACINLGAAPLASPTFTGTPTAPTPSMGDVSTQIATTEFVNQSTGGTIPSALIYKGAVDITAPPPSSPVNGFSYRVTTGGAPNSGYIWSDNITLLDVGDFIIFNGTTWDREANINPTVIAGANIAITPIGDTSYTVSLIDSPNLAGTPTAPTPSASDNSNKIATTAFVKNNVSSTLVLSGDVTGSGAGNIVTTLNTVNANTGVFGSSTLIPVITVNNKGLITAASTATAAPNWSTITGKPTTISGYGITDAAPINSPIFTGTPKAPTVTAGDSSSAIATTAFVSNAVTVNKITLQGDVTGSGAGTFVVTLNTVNANTGIYGSSTNIPVITVNNKGLITAASTATFSPTWSAISGKPTTLVGYGITDGVPLNSPAFTGTPTAPTPNVDDNSTLIATTAFVQGAITVNNTITLTGAATGSGTTSIPVTLATTGVVAGTYGQYVSSPVSLPLITVDVDGRITSASNVTVTGANLALWQIASTFYTNYWSADQLPSSNNARTLGNATYKWASVWSNTGTIQTSDAREKTEITPSVLGLDFINALQPVSYKWIVGKNIVTKYYIDQDGIEHILEGDIPENCTQGRTQITPVPGARTHFGLISQQVKKTCDDFGVDFGGWVLADKDNPDSQQALRYDQFISPLIKAVQELSTEQNSLEKQLEFLVDQVNKLETRQCL